MKYREDLIPTTVSRLRDLITATLMRAPTRHFPESYDFEGAYYMLEQGVERLRNRLGEAKSDQLLDMMAQAKAHHVAGDKLGSRLLQDADMVVANRQPYAYPKHLYRWPLDPALPEWSDADVLRDRDTET